MVNLREIPAVIIERHGLRASPTTEVWCSSLLTNYLWPSSRVAICRKALAQLALHGYHADPPCPLLAHETRATGFVLVWMICVKYTFLSAD
jgi:hypothetical protein